MTNYAAGRIDGYRTVLFVGRSTDPTEHFKLELSSTVAQGTLGGQSQHFTVLRPGLQRLHSTEMNKNLENGLYYMDVELVSEGVGDQWNLDQSTLFSIAGHQSDGYRLVVQDPDLSYSMEEDVQIVLSRRLLTVGRSDRPDEATQLSDQNIQVNYDRSPLASSIQSFASSALERVLNASLLVRHLQPHYINFSLTYRGGSSSDVVKQDVETYLTGLAPDDRLEASDLIGIPQKRGATYVQTPLELIAIVHDEERKISVDRSEDYVTHGRLATFFEGTISVTRETPSSL